MARRHERPAGGRHGEDGVLDSAFFYYHPWLSGHEVRNPHGVDGFEDLRIWYLLFWDGMGPCFVGMVASSGVLVLVWELTDRVHGLLVFSVVPRFYEMIALKNTSLHCYEEDPEPLRLVTVGAG